MKNLLSLSLILLLTHISLVGQTKSNIQNPLSINTDASDPDPSAILHIQDTSRGILIPNMTTQQRTNIVAPANGLLVRDQQDGNFWFWNGAKWVNMGEPQIIKDADGDTEVNIGDPGDNDEVTIILKGLQVLRVKRNNPDKATMLTFEGSQSNVLLGSDAGRDLDGIGNVVVGQSAAANLPSGGGNVIIGQEAAANASLTFNSVVVGNAAGSFLDGGDCTYIGAFSGQNSGGGENTYIGSGAGTSDTSGSGNVLVGRFCGFNSQGSNNVYLGYGAGLDDTSGTSNIFIGHESGSKSKSSNSLYFGSNSGQEATGNGNIFIGPSAGRFSTESQRLMINNNSDTALIWGAFDTRRIGIDRVATTNTLEVNGNASKASAGDWLANSDARLKKNIQPLNSSEVLELLLQLQGLTYEWNDKVTGTKRPSGVQYGFTAQNIQEVFPNLVKEDAQGFLQTPYGTYDAMMVEGFRALDTKLTDLENENRALNQKKSDA